MPFWKPVGSDLLGAIHLANSRGGFEPQRGHNFELVITPPTGDAEILFKSVETAAAISHNSEPLAIPYMNETVYIAGRPLYAPGAVVYRDMVDKQVWSTIEAWYRSIYDVETSEIGFAADYKAGGTLILYDVKGNNIREWDLIGLWPQDISSEAPSHMSGDIFRINVTFQYDKAKPLFAY